MIEAKDVTLQYANGTQALKKFKLKIKPGEMIYITGASGSGKTSLLKLLMGIEYPSTGDLTVLGQSISKENVKQIRKMRMAIGPVFQEFKLVQGRTALENVVLGMRFLNFTHSKLHEYSNDALIRVGLGDKRSSLVDNLSWGECQRVAIARAVARKPALILADEPTGNLDINNSIKILDLLKSFKNPSTSIIITTHATHLIKEEDADKHIKIDEGNLLCEGMEWA